MCFHHEQLFTSYLLCVISRSPLLLTSHSALFPLSFTYCASSMVIILLACPWVILLSSFHEPRVHGVTGSAWPIQQRGNRLPHYVSGRKQLTLSHNRPASQTSATQWVCVCRLVGALLIISGKMSLWKIESSIVNACVWCLKWRKKKKMRKVFLWKTFCSFLLTAHGVKVGVVTCRCVWGCRDSPGSGMSWIPFFGLQSFGSNSQQIFGASVQRRRRSEGNEL